MSRVFVLGSFPESLINFRGPLLQLMSRQGNEVYAAAPNASITVKEKISEYSVHYININLHRTGINPFIDIFSFFSLYRALYKTKPDIFLGYTIKPVIYGSLAAKLSGVSHIYSIITGIGYSFVSSKLKAKLLGVITRILYKCALRYNEKVFFQNSDDSTLFENNGLLRTKDQVVHINGSGVLIDYFTPVPFPSHTSFLIIARLLYDKGILEYIGAAQLIKKRYPNASFKIVGWLDDNPNSIHQSELDLWIAEGTIEFLGKLEDVRPAIASCSVYVLPSYREGTPRTVLEAMAMGRPIITTDTAGCRETVKQGENGYLVPIKNCDALADAMEKFIQHPELIEQMGRRSREIAVEKFDVNKVNATILENMGLFSHKMKITQGG